MEASKEPTETKEAKENDIAARREARRKKILENSSGRLGRITGRDHGDENRQNVGSAASENVVYPDPEDERDVFVPQSMPNVPSQIPPEFFGMNGGPNAFNEQQQFFELFNTLQQQQGGPSLFSNMNDMNAFAQFSSFGGGDGPNPFAPNTDDSEKPPESRLSKFLKTKIHIGLLSIFTYLLIVLAPFHCNVFLIFLLWEITEILLLRQHQTSSGGFVNVVFMLGGVSPNKVNVVMKWIQLVNKVLRDVAIFIFFFVLSHLVFVYRHGLSLIPEVTNTRNQFHEAKILVEDRADDSFENFDL